MLIVTLLVLVLSCSATSAGPEATTTAAGQVETTTEKPCVPDVHIYMLLTDMAHSMIEKIDGYLEMVSAFIDRVGDEQMKIEQMKKAGTSNGQMKLGVSILRSETKFSGEKTYGPNNWVKQIISMDQKLDVSETKAKLVPLFNMSKKEWNKNYDNPICSGFDYTQKMFLEANNSATSPNEYVKNKVIILVNKVLSKTAADNCPNQFVEVAKVAEQLKEPNDVANTTIVVIRLPTLPPDKKKRADAVGDSQMEIASEGFHLISFKLGENGLDWLNVSDLTQDLFDKICVLTKERTSGGTIINPKEPPPTGSKEPGAGTTSGPGPGGGRKNGDNNNSLLGIIIGAIAGGLIFLVIIVTVIGVVYFKRNKLKASGAGGIAPVVRGQGIDVNMYDE